MSIFLSFIQFDCCGIRNYSDFKIMAEKWTERVSRIIPIACCKLNKQKFYTINVFVVNDLTCTTAPTYNNSNIARVGSPGAGQHSRSISYSNTLTPMLHKRADKNI